MTDLSRTPASAPANARVPVATLRGQKLGRKVRLATPRQLWRLNEQGALLLALPPEPMRAGCDPPHPSLLNSAANEALDRLLAERWPPLEGFPAAGMAWSVRNGLVVPLPVVVEEP